ncbi:hypothetical protein PS15p_212127 [Mucor circinelloides]
MLYKYTNISVTFRVCSPFAWCKRKDKDAAASIFFVTQEKSPTTLLDGIGYNERSLPCFVIESSG